MKSQPFMLVGILTSFSLLSSCISGWHGDARDFRQDMRSFIQEISAYAHSLHTDFIVIPQNGHQLLTENGASGGIPDGDYIDAIDGIGREDLFYGYIRDDTETPEVEKNAMLAFMDLAEEQGVEVLVTDYCFTHTKMDESYSRNDEHSFISFAADSRGLDTIPAYPSEPYNMHSGSISALGGAKNFLYLLDPSGFDTKTGYLNAIDVTNYDLVVMDLFWDDGEGNTVALSSDELEPLKTKADGGRRLLICYMSIGEAEDYRFYWDGSWRVGAPSWLAEENPSWKGNYKVEYWNPDWQAVIFGNDGAYLDMILAAGFDGVYLDIVDGYQYFEEALGL